MVIARIISLVFFLLLALSLVAWQAWAMLDLSAPLNLDAAWQGWALYGGALGLGLLQGFLLSRFELGRLKRGLAGLVVYGGLALTLYFEFNERIVHDSGWGFLFPHDLLLLLLLAAAAMPLILGRGDDLRAIAEKTGLAIVLGGLNLALPLVMARQYFPSELATMAGLSAVALLFFLFVDYYLIRALVHYFTSGATTFVSMRYLRKRPVSLASIMGVAAGICVLIVVNSIMNGFTSEYRTQVRGTMSDILVYVEPDLYYPSERDVDIELWAFAHRAISADATTRKQWDDALAHAQDELAESESGVYSEEEAKQSTFPASRKPSPDQKSFELQRLDSPNGATFAHLLPVHPKLGRATPVAIYFATRYPNAADRPNAIESLRAKLASKLFVPRMHAGMDVLAKVAASNPKTEAFAPRLQNITVLTSEGRDDVFQQAQIVGLDPKADLKVTNVGDFVRDALYDTTRQDKVILPVLRLYNGILLFEDASPEMLERRLTPLGFDPNGKLLSPHGSWRDYVMERSLIAPNGAIQWARVDQVRFRDGTPGARLFKVWRAALKRLVAAKDPATLKTIVLSLEDELLAIIDDSLGKADNRELYPKVPSAWTDARERFGAMQSYVPEVVDDPRLVLAYFRYWYVQGIWRQHAATSSQLNSVNRELAHAIKPFEDREGVLVEPNQAIKDLAAGIDRRIHGFIEGVLPDLLNADAFGQARAAFFAEVREFRDSWIASGTNNVDLDEFSPAAFSILQVFDRDDGNGAFRSAESSALSDVVATWDERWREALRRTEGYRQVLPLRAYLLDYESVDEYVIRASGRLAYRAKDELWQDTQAEFLRARDTAIAMLREGFVAHRITRTAPRALPLDAAMAEREQALFNEITAAAQNARVSIEETNAQAGVEALEQHLENFRQFVEELYNARGRELRKEKLDFGPEMRELFRVVSDDREYWKLRPAVPGVILGSSLAEQVNARIGSKVQAHIVRITKRERGEEGSNHAFRAGEESFRVNAHFKSGLYAANVESLFGDFETWMGLFGASRATYVMAIKLKGFDAAMSVPATLVGEYESKLDEMRHAIVLPSLEMGAEDKPLSVEESAILSGWSANPGARFGSRGDKTRFTTWEKQNAALLSAVEREKDMLTLLLMLIEVLAGVVILIVVYLTVVEKIKDIGILKAMGASPWGVRSIFMFNALYIGVFGTLIGAGLAILISENLNQIEDWIEANFGVRLFPPDIYYLTYIPSIKGEALMALAVKMSVPTTLWAFFCGIGPAMVASKKDTVEALQYE